MPSINRYRVMAFRSPYEEEEVMHSRTGLRTIACALLLAITTIAQAGDDENAPPSRPTTLKEAWNKKPSELARPPKPMTSTRRLPGSDLHVIPNAVLAEVRAASEKAELADDEDAPASKHLTLEQAWNMRQSDMPQRPAPVATTKLPGSDLRVMPNATLGAKGADIYAGVQARMDADAKEQKRKDDLPYSEVNSAIVMNGPIGAVIKFATRPAYEPQAGFKVDWDAVRKNTGDQPFTSPEIDLLSQAVSAESLRALEWEVNNNRDTAKTASAKGGPYEAVVSWAPVAMLVGTLAVLLFRRLRR